MTKKDGDPAFPQMRVWHAERAEYEDTQQYPGMSLRDYFAAHAPPIPDWMLSSRRQDQMFDAMVKWRWDYADAMIKARVQS